MGVKIYSFIFTMWILMLIGGGLMVLVIGPFSLGSIDIDPIILSGVKVASCPSFDFHMGIYTNKN